MSDTFSAAQFTGKVAVITGAAQGIGEATARLMAGRGAAGLLLTDRQAEKGEAVAAELRGQGTEARFVAADLADPEAPARIIAAADEAFGRIDVLANIAGLTDRGSIRDTDLTLFDRMFAINVRALATLTRNVANVMARQRIRVNGLNIGWVDTPGEHVTRTTFDGVGDNWLDEAESSRPWGRLLKPLDIARAIAFLASGESGIVTGSVIDFDQTVFGGL